MLIRWTQLMILLSFNDSYENHCSKMRHWKELKIKTGNLSFRFSWNSEASASDFRMNLEEITPGKPDIALKKGSKLIIQNMILYRFLPRKYFLKRMLQNFKKFCKRNISRITMCSWLYKEMHWKCNVEVKKWSKTTLNGTIHITFVLYWNIFINNAQIELYRKQP